MATLISRIATRVTGLLAVLLGLGDDAISVGMENRVNRPRAYARTDSGNAELFAALFGQDVRFDHRQQRWLIWDTEAKRWSEDKEGRVRGLMKETARYRQKRALNLPESEDRKHEIRWSFSSESRKSIDAALDLAKSERPIRDKGEAWDANQWVLGVANGVVDLREGAVRDATRADYLTKYSSVVYASDATCPRFDAFIHEIFNGDADLVRFVQKAVGYSLTGSVKEQCLFACYGEGRNGKSTLLEVLLHILGDYGVDLPFSSLEAKQSAAPGEGVNLPGTRFAKSVEVREGRRLDEARIKGWTGGDTISVRPLYRNAFSFKPTHKIWLAFNHKPVITDDSPGMWRRIRLIPFQCKFDGQQADQDLLEKLKAEASGILNWAIEGCLAWQAEGLPLPEAVQDATHRYHDESDVLAPFLEDRCEIGSEVSVTSADLWTAYQKWASENSERLISRTAFADRLKRRGFVPAEDGHDKTRIWRGLRLLPPVAGVRAGAGAESDNFSLSCTIGKLR